MKKRKNKSLLIYTMLTIPALVLYVIFWLIPLLMGINYSFTDWNGLTKDFNYVGLENYITVFTQARTRSSFVFTAKYSILLVIFVMVIAILLTLMLTYVVAAKFKTAFRSVFFFPAVLSTITVSLTWNQIFYRVLPAIGEALNIGWLSKNLLGDPKTAMWAILIINIWQGVAQPFVILLAGIQNVPKDQYEAAKIDGASPFRLFWNITVPHMMPTINFAFVLVLKAGINVFDYIQGTTGGGPMQATESAGILIYNLAFKNQKVSLASAFSVILLISVCVISLVQQKLSSKYEVGQV